MTAKGTTYYQPLPVDFLILEALPAKGILGGVHWAGRPVKHVLQDIHDGMPAEAREHVGTSTLMARLRSMKVAGHVEDFASVGSGRIWARTPDGTALLATKSEVLGLPEPAEPQASDLPDPDGSNVLPVPAPGAEVQR